MERWSGRVEERENVEESGMRDKITFFLTCNLKIYAVEGLGPRVEWSGEERWTGGKVEKSDVMRTRLTLRRHPWEG